MYCLKKDDVTYKLRALCMPCTSLITDQESLSGKYCHAISGLVRWKPLNESEERRLFSSGLTRLPLKGLLMIVFHALIWVLCFKWKKKRFVYSGYLEREVRNISAHGPKRKTCQKKKRKVQHALDFVSINLLFRGKHECLGRQLLWPFLFLELSIKL